VSSRDVVVGVLNRVRPFLRSDGGDLELVAMDRDDVVIRLTGACSGCPQAQMTLQFGIEAALREQIPGVRLVQVG